MFELVSQSPLTPLEMWQLVAVLISTVFVVGVAMVGLWSLFGPVAGEPEPRPNRRLSHIERLVKTGSLKRML